MRRWQPRILELGKQRGSAFALYRQGADAMQKGNTEEAIVAYQKALDGGNAEARYRLAIWTAQSRQTATCPRKNSNRY